MDIFKFQVSKLVFECINMMLPVNFHGWFELNHERHGYNTRSNFNINNWTITQNIFIPSARTTNYGLKQLGVNGPSIWNSLPLDMKMQLPYMFS